MPHETETEALHRLHEVLTRIAKAYQTPDQLRRSAEKQYGLPYAEVLEMAYENIQLEARAAIKGMRLTRKEQV